MKRAGMTAATLLGLAMLGADAPRPAEVTIRGGFSPATVTVKLGQAVIWTNRDDADHALSGDRAFKSGNIKRGDKFQHAFPKAGRYPYSCTYHPREKGTVVVE